MAAMWLQGTDAISLGNAKLLMILIAVFIGMVAVAMLTQTIVQIAFSVKAAKAIKGMVALVEEFNQRALPLIDSAREIAVATQYLVNDTAPKVKVIADNLLETSVLVRDSAQQFDKTIADANVRAQRQVARVDGMITAALTTTVEVAETIRHGIEVPARKIAVLATQAKAAFDAVLAKVKAMAAGSGSGSR